MPVIRSTGPDIDPGPGGFGSGTPLPLLGLVEMTGLPTFLGDPMCAFALVFDPGRISNARPLAACRCCPRADYYEGSSIGYFEAQSHGFSTRCLRFAEPVTRTRRKTRFRLLARLYRTDPMVHEGPSERFQSCFLHLILLSQTSWRKIG